MKQYFNRFYKPLTRFTVAGLLMAAILFVVNVNTCKAEGKPKTVSTVLQTDSVYFRVDVQPSFPGGGEAFYKFLGKNIKYPAIMKQRQVQGNVIVQFVVEKDGTLTNIKAIKGSGSGSAEEAVRVMQASPKWKPGVKDGKPVRVQFAVPVTFVIKKEEQREEEGGFKISGN
jgi:TonB family protein